MTAPAVASECCRRSNDPYFTTVVPFLRPAIAMRAMISTNAMIPMAIQTGWVYQALRVSVVLISTLTPDGSCSVVVSVALVNVGNA